MPLPGEGRENSRRATFDEPLQHPAQLRPISSGGLGQLDVASIF
ncbi:MAG: hypothetical protein ACM3MK_05885 [Chitinophagales bacterium]